MSKNKTERVDFRCDKSLLKKLTAICRVNNKTRTEVIRDLIIAEFKKNKAYEDLYYADLDKDQR